MHDAEKESFHLVGRGSLHAAVCYSAVMMKVLEQAIEKIKGLPEERQEAAAAALELIAAQVDNGDLTADEIAGVREARDAVRRGEIASDERVETFFRRHLS